MTPGAAFVIEQLGLALAASDARLAALTAENEQLRQALVETLPTEETS